MELCSGATVFSALPTSICMSLIHPHVHERLTSVADPVPPIMTRFPAATRVSNRSVRLRSYRTLIKASYWGVLLWVLTPQRDARAEDSLTYKFQSWQEDNGRVRVDAHYAQAETTLSTETKFKLMGLIDTITGATPSGQPAPTGSDQVPLSTLTDRREAWQAEVTHPFKRVTVSAGLGRSVESDYIADVWSLNTMWDFNQKNTTLLLGYARADDRITATPLPAPRDKLAEDAIIGLTQVLSPRTVLTANLSYGKTNGYISDPYKIIQKRTEILPGFELDLTFPENRPDTKDKWIAFVGVNHSLENLKGSIWGSYRLLDDTFGVTSHTVELKWFQRLGEHVVLEPSVRVYQQSAADFYRVSFDGVSISPGNVATGQAPYYSSDYRLSKMRTWMLGLKLVWEVNDWCAVDLSAQRYLMRGLDGVTPRSAYADANVFTVGVKLWR